MHHKSFKTSVLFFCALIDEAVSSLTTTAATVAVLAHMSQRANEEDSGPTHICFRGQAICCKCV